MGFVPLPPPPPRLNLDRFGMPRDFTTYMWVTYRQRVADNSPERRAFMEVRRVGAPFIPASSDTR